jgi:hypothetical protein
MFESEWKLYERKWGDRNLVLGQLQTKVIKARAAVNSMPMVSGGLVSCSNSAAKKLTDAISSKVKIT